MAEHTERGLFHHHKKPEDEVLVESTTVHASTTSVDGKPVDSKVEIKKHSHKEHLGEAGALLGGAVAMHELGTAHVAAADHQPSTQGWLSADSSEYEKHQAKKDPENAHKHHIGQAVAGAVAIGSGAFAVHEHHDKKDAEKEAKHHHSGH